MNRILIWLLRVNFLMLYWIVRGLTALNIFISELMMMNLKILADLTSKSQSSDIQKKP